MKTATKLWTIWPEWRMRFLLRKQSTAEQHTRLQIAEQVSFVPMEAVGENGGLNLDITRDKTSVEKGYTLFFDGDVIVAKITPCFENGKGALAIGLYGGIAYGTTELHVLSPLPELDKRFLFYLTISHTFRKQGEAAMKGAAGQKRVPDEFIQDLRFSLPPLAIQRRMADYLDTETSQIDTLIAEKERMLALLEEKRAALVSRTVTRGLNPNVPMKPSGLDWLGDIPEHWEILQLKRTWSSAEYGISEDIRGEGSVKVLRMSCIVDGRIDLTNAGEVAQVPPHLLVHEGDLLFNRTNSLDQVAKVGLLDQEPELPTSFASYLVRIRANEMVSQDYLVASLNSREFLNYARSNAIPAIGQANLNPARYGNIQIPLPPRDEQDVIVAALAQERARTAELEASLYRSITLLKERRSALITAAVTGQLEPEAMKV